MSTSKKDSNSKLVGQTSDLMIQWRLVTILIKHYTVWCLYNRNLEVEVIITSISCIN